MDQVVNSLPVLVAVFVITAVMSRVQFRNAWQMVITAVALGFVVSIGVGVYQARFNLVDPKEYITALLFALVAMAVTLMHPGGTVPAITPTLNFGQVPGSAPSSNGNAVSVPPVIQPAAPPTVAPAAPAAPVAPDPSKGIPPADGNSNRAGPSTAVQNPSPVDTSATASPGAIQATITEYRQAPPAGS